MAKKSSEWYFGVQHDEILDQTLRARERAQRRLEASLGGRGKDQAALASAKAAKVPVTDLMRVLREHINYYYDEVFDAFTDVDLNGNGRLSKAEFRQGIEAMGPFKALETGKFTKEQLDDLFEQLDSKSESSLRLEHFVKAFDPDKSKAKRRDGKDTHKGAGKGTSASSSFTEVYMECKDESGAEQSILVKVSMKWEDLLEKLSKAFKRPVTFMYEDVGGHQYTVKSAADLAKCWASVQALKGDGVKHFECMIVDFDTATGKTKGGKSRGRLSLSERRQGVAKVQGTGGVGTDMDREPVESVDFRSRHKWIDDMMRLLGAPLENEPGVMHNKWDQLMTECQHLDIASTGSVTVEGFRNALTRTEPRMTAEHVEWYIKDADKNVDGDVLYDTYAKTKKQGQMAGGAITAGGASQTRELSMVTEKIMNALKNNFKSLQQAFKRMDQDRDGRLSRDEFRKGVKDKLKLALPTRLLDEVIRKVDKGADGYIDYEDFLAEFNKFDRKDDAGKDDGLSDEEITQTVLGSTLNIAKIFEKMDDNGDGVLSDQELLNGLASLGIKLGKARLLRYMGSMDIDGNRTIDYREFLRKLSSVQLRDVTRKGHDKMAQLEDIIKNKLREEYDDAKQAFHNLDVDADGRLSLKEFLTGIFNLKIEESLKDDDDQEIYLYVKDERQQKQWLPYEEAEPRVEVLRKLFEHCNSSGDGYLAYHEFLFRFPVRPKPLQLTVPFDQELRSELRKQFPSVTEAFMALDMDHDNRLSTKDIMDGLATNKIWTAKFADDRLRKQLEEAVAGLVARAATTDKEHIDYYDFIVRFGLDTKADGRWVYKERTDKKFARPFEDLAKRWRDLLPKSKWHGRGGIKNTLMRYDDSKTGSMSKRQFSEALRDGLLMGESLSDAKDLNAEKGGFIVGRPWTTEPKDKDAVDKNGNKAEPTIDIDKFMSHFIDVYFERDKVLYDVLLVKNRWVDMQQAFKTCSSVSGNKNRSGETGGVMIEANLITKADFGHALQGLVERGKLTENERKIVIECCEHDKCFLESGKYVGYVDFDDDFLRHYIPVDERSDEIEIYEKVYQKWEVCDEAFAKMGSVLSYLEFESLIRSVLAGDEALKTEQIAFLIDVVDSNGDGSIGRSEFISRYAREDAVIQRGLRENWFQLINLFHNDNKKGSKAKPPEYTLTAEAFSKCLLEGVKLGYFEQGKISGEQLKEVITNLPAHFKVAKGGQNLIRYDEWLKKYIPDYYEIHFAFTGLDRDKMPKWDAVIAAFEMLDKCRMQPDARGSDRRLPWDHFRKALRMADINLGAKQVQKIIESLDKNMTGFVCWTDMVGTSVAPYFFNGKDDFEMRQILCQIWPALHEKCREREIKTRKIEKGLLPSKNFVLPPKYFEECLTDSPKLNLTEDPKTKAIVKKIVEVCELAFLKKENGVDVKDRNEKKLIDYEAVCRHYAGASFDAEREFERKWEVVIEVLKELRDGNVGRQLSREAFKVRLSDSALHVSDATIDYLLREQPADTVDMDAICWRTAKRTILKILKIKWSLLMNLFRAKDPFHKRHLSKETVQQILDRADVGMSTSLVEILMGNLLVEDDGKIDYDKLLSGKLKSGAFSMEVYTAYKTMESEWESLSSHFWEFDLNGDGKISHEEFKVALRNLQHPALADPIVINDLIKHLDPDDENNIDFDRFSWNMARRELKSVVEQRGKQMLAVFRREATRRFEDFEGLLPKQEAIHAISRELFDSGIKPILVKILLSRAEAMKRAAAEKPRNWLEEAQLARVLREIAGDSFDKAEESMLRESFLAILGASKLNDLDHWRLHGEDNSERKALAGAASLGPDAMKFSVNKEVFGVGVPYKRRHMHFFLKEGGKNMLESMKASAALMQIKEDRVRGTSDGKFQAVYSRDPWISFWQQRSKYTSPALSMLPTAGGGGVGSSTGSGGAPSRPHGTATRPAQSSSRGGVGSWTSTSIPVQAPAKQGSDSEGGQDSWLLVRKKVQKAAFEKFQTNQEALDSLDPESTGAGALTTQAVCLAIESWVPGITAAELEIITQKLDPGRDGMVLRSDVVHYLLPEDTNRRVLERLAHERHARGIYARLQNRQTGVPPPASMYSPSFPATGGARPTRSNQGTLPAGGSLGGAAEVVDRGYQYNFGWNRVDHAPPARSQVVRESATRPAYGALPGGLRNEPDAASTARAMMGLGLSQAQSSHSAPSATLTGYMASSPYGVPATATALGSDFAGAQQRPGLPIQFPSALAQMSARDGADLDSMYRSTMQQLLQLQENRQ